jgi:hypothetical protein
MAGFKVVSINALDDGSLDLPHLKEMAQKHKNQLAAFMVRGLFLSSHSRVSHYTGHLPFDFRRL